MTKEYICQNCSKVMRIPARKIETFNCPGCKMHVWVEHSWGVHPKSNKQRQGYKRNAEINPEGSQYGETL